MPSSYPTSLDPIPLPDFTSDAPEGSLGQTARPAGEYLTDLTDSVKATQAAVGTTTAPGPLLASAGAGANTLSADKTGLVDASADVQAWVTNLAGSGGTGYAPPGDYLLNSAAALTGLSSSTGAIRGAGEGLTRFIIPATNTTGCFLFDATGSPHDAEFHFSDFSIVTRGVGTGTGIKFAMEPGGNQHNRSVTIENVRIYGENTTTHCFQYGVDVRSTWRPYLRNVTIGGPFGTGITDNYADNSPQYVTEVGLVLDDAYAWHVEGCNIWSANTGIRDIGTTSEGGRLLSTQIVAVRVALDRQRTADEPSLIIQNCHWNYRDTGLNIDGARLVRIIGNHPYCQDTANVGGGVSRDIWLKNTQRNIILANEFQFTGVADRINIHVDGGAGIGAAMGRDMIIDDNIFGSGGANAILLGTLTSGVTVTPNNLYPGTYTKNVVDNSGSSGDVYRFENQSVGSTVGPDLQIVRDSLSPATADFLGGITFKGKDSVDAETAYAMIRSHITDPTDGSEDGAISVWVTINGAPTKVGQYSAPAVGETAQYLVVNRAGTLTLERVTLGPDTGGFMYLRVPSS